MNEVILQDDGPDPAAVPEDFEEDLCDVPLIEHHGSDLLDENFSQQSV